MKKLFITVLIIRLVLSFLPSMQIDMGCWKAWAMRMVEVGPQNFYSTKIFTDNPPGYLYIFWVVGWVREWLVGLGAVNFEWLLKLPGNLFDLGTGVIIYKIIKGKMGEKGNWGKWGFLLYTLNPAIWFNSSVFGQFDGAGAFFGLLAVYLILEKKRIGWAAVALAVAWAVKPQAIALGPAVGILMLCHPEHFNCHSERSEVTAIRRDPAFGGKSQRDPSLTLRMTGFVLRMTNIFKAVLGFVGTTLLLYWPFFPKNPLSGIFYVFSRMNNIYSCTTCFAFNFWGMFGNWQNDQALFFGVPLMWWGIGLAIIAILGVWGKFIYKNCHSRESGNPGHSRKTWIPDQVGDDTKSGRTYLAIAISIMAFFMFATRMHERYLLTFFPFMLIAGMLLKSKFLMLYYLFLSGLSLLNVYYPYANYNPQYGLTPGLVVWLGEHFRALSMVSFGSFLGLWGWSLKNAQ